MPPLTIEVGVLNQYALLFPVLNKPVLNGLHISGMQPLRVDFVEPLNRTYAS